MNPIMKAMAKVHTAVIQLSGGRLGNKMGGNEILLLHHTGAKSGKQYVIGPLALSPGYYILLLMQSTTI